jgi:zinc protease
MKKKFVAGLLACALVLSSASVVQAAPMPAVTFPQERSSLKPDPEVVYGRLPNGLTYAIRKNATPAGTAAILMRVDVGSMMETEKERGLAHFIEHMAFNGTTHIPEGELKKTLERHGFSFGVDANAFTSDSRTIYKLMAPKTDAKTLDTSLFILREIAGNMTLGPDAIDRERGVILGEERLRDNANARYGAAHDRWLFEGQKYAGYSRAIGSTDVIKTVSRAEMTAFYNNWYRPDLTTLVVVGDVDPAQMEAKIKAVFSDWKAKTAMPPEPDWGAYGPKGVRAFTYTEKDLRESLAFRWVKPLDTRQDSVDKRIGSLQDTVIITLLNRRFQKRLSEPNASYVSASVSLGTAFKTGRILTLSITPRPGKARQAFEQAYDILHTFTDSGITEQEAADIGLIFDSVRKTLAESLKTRNTPDLANNLLNAIDGNTVFLGEEDGLVSLDTARPKLSLADLNARRQELFSGDGPILVHAGETLGDFGEAEMKADYAAISTVKAATYKEKERKPWPYTDFGTPASPASHSVDKDFGYGHYVYPNGVILNIKPTKLTANEVLVEVDFPGGMQKFDPKSSRPYPLATATVFLGGGLGQLKDTELKDTLSTKRYGLGFAIRDAAAYMSGRTINADLPTQLQVMAAYLTDPGFRPSGFNTIRATADAAVKTYKATPTSAFAYNFQRILRSSDPRYDSSILERVKDVKFDDIRSLIADTLADTPITVTLVGDVDEAQAVIEVGKTFGALPKRPTVATRFPGADKLDFPPKEHEFTLYHEGRNDQSLSATVWPTTDFYADSKQGRGLSILAAILKNRLYDDLREKLGADYAPTAASSQSDDYPGFGHLDVLTTVKAGDDALFRASLDHIVAELKTKPVSDDEMLRVKTPIFDDLANADKTNAYWLGLLTSVEFYGDKARQSRLHRRADIESVTAQDVMRLAQKYLLDATAIHIKVLPSPKPAESAPHDLPPIPVPAAP